jgi:hypothetical protein
MTRCPPLPCSNCSIVGECYHSYANPHAGPAAWPFDQKFHLLLNVAIGGSWGGSKGVDDAAYPCAFEIAYVRVYEDTTPGADLDMSDVEAADIVRAGGSGAAGAADGPTTASADETGPA